MKSLKQLLGIAYAVALSMNNIALADTVSLSEHGGYEKILNGSAPTGHEREAGIAYLRLKEVNSLGSMKVGGCSAVFLNNRWVLTAAHCVIDKSYTLLPADLEIVLSPTVPDARWISSGPTFDVSAIVLHPSLNGIANKDIDIIEKQVDLALLYLAAPAQVNGTTTKFKQPVYNGDADSLDKKKITAYGHGLSLTPEVERSTRGPRIHQLLQATMQVDNKDKTFVFYTFKRNDFDQMTYFGDSGGPSFLEGTSFLTGIHNGGSGDIDHLPTIGFDVSAEHIRAWALPVINTEPEGEDLGLITLNGTKNLSNAVIAKFSTPKGGLSDLRTMFRVEGSYLSSWASVSPAGSFNSDIHGQPRDLYELKADNYDIDLNKCAPFFSAHLCTLRTTLIVNHTTILPIKSYALVIP